MKRLDHDGLVKPSVVNDGTAIDMANLVGQLVIGEHGPVARGVLHEQLRLLMEECFTVVNDRVVLEESNHEFRQGANSRFRQFLRDSLDSARKESIELVIDLVKSIGIGQDILRQAEAEELKQHEIGVLTKRLDSLVQSSEIDGLTAEDAS